MNILASKACLVGPSGLEPPTSCLSGTRSNLLSYEPMWLVSDSNHLVGGDDGIRTHDPLLAGQVLSQLSYTPILLGFRFSLPFFQDRGTVLSVPLSCVSIELSSRAASRKVFSPLQSLTSVFGMGTGGPSAFVTLTSFIQLTNRSLKIEQHLISREISLSFDTRQSSFLFFHELHSITFRYTVRSP